MHKSLPGSIFFFLLAAFFQITSRLAISRLIYSISYTLHSKEDLDELCGDLHAIRIIAQSTGVPISVRAQLKAALKASLTKCSNETSDKGKIYFY